MFLADTGAVVIKVEPPEGDPIRQHPAFLQWLRGKKSIALDLKEARDVQIAHALVAQADVVLESFRPGVAERLGIGYSTLAGINPRLIYATIRGFGDHGPYSGIKGYEAIVAAKSGQLRGRHPWRREGPLFEAIPRMSLGAAHLATQGILSALLARERSGQGQRIESTLIAAATAHTLTGWQVPLGEEEAYAALANAPLQFKDPHDMGTIGYTIAECKDGRWLQVASTTVHIFRSFLNLIGLSDVYNEPGTNDLPYTFPTPSAKEELRGKIKDQLRTKTSAEWVKLILENGNCSAEPFETVRGYMDHPQAVHNGLFIEVDDPRVGRMKQISPLVDFSETRSVIQGPAPSLDQHRKELLQFAAEQVPPAPQLKAQPVLKPLDDITVLELASYYAAPFGATLLADMGARVIKIEPPTGDLMRRLGSFVKTVQGKESISVDLKQAQGREILYRLVGKADALLHNFRPGAEKRIGLEYGTLSQINPRLVYLYAGAYGSSGPHHRLPAFHPTVSAITGSGLRAAGPGNPPMDAGHGDPDAALGVATALLLGIRAARLNEKGQYLETRMITTGAYEVSDALFEYSGCPPEPAIDALQQGFHALYRLYETGDGWILLACPQENEWTSLCNAIEREDLAQDPRFGNLETRRKYDTDLIGILESVFRNRSANEWERRLTDADVACVRADGQSWDAFWIREPWIKTQGLRTATSHPYFGKPYHRHGPPVRFSSLEGTAGPPATIGQHTRPILTELGYSEATIDGHEKAGVILSEGPWVHAR